MARQTHTPQSLLGAFATDGKELTFLAANTTDKEQVVASSRDLILARNVNASTTAHTVTINSAADPYGRTGDVTADSIPAGKTHAYGPFPKLGWAQSDGKLYFEANHVEIEFAVIALP